MQAPTISVIVPVYKVEKYLARCVDSILGQTFRDLEVLLVDDGSPDRCGALCDAYAGKDSRVRVLHKENGGLSDARNAGIDAARGEWLAFVDSDDYIDPDMYAFLYEAATREEACVATCGLYDQYANRHVERPAGGYYRVTDAVEAVRIVLEAKITSVTVVNKLYRRELFEGLRFRKGKTAEDAFIMVDLLSRAERIVITNEPKYCYFHRENSITTSPFNPRDLDAVEAYEYNARRALELSNSLADAVLLRRCWARFYVLDKLMVSDEPLDHPLVKEYRAFLKENLGFILKSSVFTKGRKLAALVLMVSTGWYRRIVTRYRKGKRINA